MHAYTLILHWLREVGPSTEAQILAALPDHDALAVRADLQTLVRERLVEERDGLYSDSTPEAQALADDEMHDLANSIDWKTRAERYGRALDTLRAGLREAFDAPAHYDDVQLVALASEGARARSALASLRARCRQALGLPGCSDDAIVSEARDFRERAFAADRRAVAAEDERNALRTSLRDLVRARASEDVDVDAMSVNELIAQVAYYLDERRGRFLEWAAESQATTTALRALVARRADPDDVQEMTDAELVAQLGRDLDDVGIVEHHAASMEALRDVQRAREIIALYAEAGSTADGILDGLALPEQVAALCAMLPVRR